LSLRFDAARAALSANSPSYVVVNLENNKHVLLSHVPPTSQVRDKMLYSSSRTSLKDGLGKALFVDDYFFSDVDECTYAQYQRAQRSDDHSDVMTMAEREKMNDAHSTAPHNVKLAAMASLPLDFTSSAQDALRALQDESANKFYTFSLDAQTQAVSAESHSMNGINDVTAFTQQLHEPRYILFRYQHKHDNQSSSPLIFIYCCPDRAHHKLRMIYASSKRVMVEACDAASLTLVKKLETTESDEVTSKSLEEELYPKSAEKAAFAKPARPGRGRARMIGGGAALSDE
jgi:twinfilin-like protein